MDGDSYVILCREARDGKKMIGNQKKSQGTEHHNSHIFILFCKETKTKSICGIAEERRNQRKPGLAL
jgi:hypothetical protein